MILVENPMMNGKKILSPEICTTQLDIIFCVTDSSNSIMA